jgi:hypothetical protein
MGERFDGHHPNRDELLLKTRRIKIKEFMTPRSIQNAKEACFLEEANVILRKSKRESRPS